MAALETAPPARPLEAWRVVMSTCNATTGATDVVTRRPVLSASDWRGP